MTQPFADESGRLAIELYGALQEIDPARWHAGAADSVREKLRALSERLAKLTEQSGPQTSGALRVKLMQMRETLATKLPDEELTIGSAHAHWMAFRRELVPRYEGLKSALREFEIHVPSLRPTNYARAVFHVGSAVFTLSVLYFLPDPVWGIVIMFPLAIWAWTMEALRRTRPRMNATVMKFFAPLAHPHEYHRINSGTWFITALAVLSLSRAPLVCAVGVAVLGFGDPIAALIGRRFGRTKLMHGRTLEGSITFALAAAIGALGAAWAYAPGLSFGQLLALSLAGAVAGALTELVSLRVDDNLSVPITAGAAAALSAWAFSIPLS